MTADPACGERAFLSDPRAAVSSAQHTSDDLTTPVSLFLRTPLIAANPCLDPANDDYRCEIVNGFM